MGHGCHDCGCPNGCECKCEHCGKRAPYGCDCTTKATSAVKSNEPAPIPMLLWCPECANRHIDDGEFATKPHHTHACQECGHVWRPAIQMTVGVRFLPGFRNEVPSE